MRTFMLSAMVLCLTVGCGQTTKVDNSVVNDFDVSRFLGHWYEIARFDHSFERGMEHTEAEYTLRDDGNINVVNTGIKNGKLKTSNGRAKLTDTPALLRVSFFRPFYSDYRIMMIDSGYQYALIGSNNEKYLWILSRKPQLRAEDKTNILREALRRGYDTKQLIWVKQ